MIKLKDFTKSSFLKSFDIPVKTKATTNIAKPRVKQTKQKFSVGQVRKQASKQGVKISYKLARKIAKTKQTKQQLYNRISYQGRKQKEIAKRETLKAQGRKVNTFIARYRHLLEMEYKLHPTTENLKKLQEATYLQKEAKLLDQRYKQYWKDFRSDIKETRQRLRASRHAGNVSKPQPVGKVGTSYEDYILNNYYDQVQEIMTETNISESEAVELVFQGLVADGTLEPLNQINQTGVLYGYIDDNDEIISPI